MLEKRWVSELARELGLNAAAFIVTVYGDVVVPRGGVLWTGTLIDICAQVGINESLVRTAVSRLVAARRLRGERIGRRSYYRLDAAAQREFDHAAGLLFGPDRPASGWQILWAPDLGMEEAARMRLGHMGGAVFLRPDRGQALPEGAMLFHATGPEGVPDVARFWDLRSLQARYELLLRRFGPLEAALEGAGLPDAEALGLRLLLVHAYRAVLLRDPRLPGAVLPAGWQGHAARDLFRRLYRRLTPGSERHIAARFEGDAGPLPARTPESEQRLACVI
jgi:phenylacetic acid degradation operon negative regulatory protein